MQLYTVLVVDDESYIVGSVAALLQCQHQWNMEVYRAFSGEEALSILTTTRIDILLADIRMPGMSGLELVKRTRTLWPECMAMLLTAYDDFGSAYEAIHVGVKAFLLKTESDERLLEEVGRIVALLEEKRTQALELPPNAFQRGELNAQLLLSLLLIKRGEEQTRQLLHLLGIDSGELWLICAVAQDTEEHLSSLEWLVRDQVSHRAETIASCHIDGNLFLLMRPNAPISSLFGALELAQEHFAEAFHKENSFVLCALNQQTCNLHSEYLRINRFVEAVCGETNGFIHLLPESGMDEEMCNHSVIDTITGYIQSHLNSDLSLNVLSCLVGYNPAYLSRLFHEKTGEQISGYIAKLKIRQLQALISDASLSFNTIAESLGFNSRSYFNRYVKRLTGSTPQQLRDLAGISGPDLS